VHRRLLAVTAVLSPALVLTACGGGDSGNASLPGGPAAAGTTGAAATASPTPASADDQVLGAYRTFWDAVIAANRAADPASPRLAKAAADPELTRIRTTVARNKVQKLSLRGPVGHTPRPVAVTGATATVEDCYDISDWNPVNLATGKPVEATDESGTGRYRARYTLRRSGAGWLVVDHRALGGC
jgi:hypothetical protein